MIDENQEISLTNVKRFLSAHLESVSKIVLPLKTARLAELRIKDQMGKYHLEEDVLDICINLTNNHIDAVIQFIKLLTEDTINEETLERIDELEFNVGKIMTLLGMFARVKEFDFEKNNYDSNDFNTPDVLFKGIEQIVESIDYEVLSRNAIDEYNALLQNQKSKVEESELVESDN